MTYLTSFKPSRNNNKGFTLVEVAIVMIVGGLLLSTATFALQNYMKQMNMKKSRNQIEAINDALQRYLSLNGRYPCPAPLNADLDTSGFGFEVTPSGTDIGDCANAVVNSGETIRVTGEKSHEVRIGAVPVRTLNLPDDLIGDAWGNRYLYAVTERLGSIGTYDRDEGGIEVEDSNGNSFFKSDTDGVTRYAHYTIVSHGENQSGAWSYSGQGTAACPGGTVETENCDNDATFVQTLLRSTGNNADDYDDLVFFSSMPRVGDNIPAGTVIARTKPSCPEGWKPYTKGAGRFIVGADTSGDFPHDGEGGEKAVKLNDNTTGLTLSSDRYLADAGSVFAMERRPGGAETHNNLPPYIALTYCEKT